jgi:hypothetical protein
MKAAFGLISLLIVLAVLAWNAKHALTVSARPAAAASATIGSDVPAPPQGTPRQQVDAVQRQVQDAINQGAAARASELE